MAFLELSNLSKSYSSLKQKAVNDVSLSIEQGTVVAIVGENGSGKTTLLRLIAGLEDADSGEVYLKNKKVTGPSLNLVPGHQEIKMLAQHLNLLPNHTVVENIAYDLRGYVQEFQDERASELMSLFGLEGFEDKMPQQLSGGQQQRAALAKALAENAPVLLLDEPFSNLDVILKDEIKSKVIRKARADGVTLIFVTHDVKDALSLSDTIAVMREGKIIQADTPQNVYKKPSDEYVAYLFGSINIVPAHVFFNIFHKLGTLKKFQGLTGSKKICFRPEDITICGEAHRMSDGVVRDVAYFGDCWQLEIAVKGIILRINSKRRYAIGTKVFLKLNPSKIHVI